MPITLNWYNTAHRMIIAQFVGQWTVADFISANEKSVQLMRQVDHPVHVIYDFRESTTTPRDMMAGYQAANRIVPSNQGVVVYIGANAVMKAFVLMAKRMGLPAVKYIYHVETRDEAYRIITDKAHRVQHSA